MKCPFTLKEMTTPCPETRCWFNVEGQLHRCAVQAHGELKVPDLARIFGRSEAEVNDLVREGQAILGLRLAILDLPTQDPHRRCAICGGRLMSPTAKTCLLRERCEQRYELFDLAPQWWPFTRAEFWRWMEDSKIRAHIAEALAWDADDRYLAEDLLPNRNQVGA